MLDSLNNAVRSSASNPPSASLLGAPFGIAPDIFVGSEDFIEVSGTAG
jgi:hypothetical protein